MTTVKDKCADCRAVVQLVPCGITLTTYGSRCWYAFQCPACGVHVCRPAGNEVVRLLGSAGVRPRMVVPAPHPTIEGRVPDGPPIDRSDWADILIDLHLHGDLISELTP